MLTLHAGMLRRYTPLLAARAMPRRWLLLSGARR